MRQAITRDQLFEGAVVLYDGQERYTAIVQSVGKEQVRLLDIYGFCEESSTYSELRPCTISHYTLCRLGFRETEPLSTCYTMVLQTSRRPVSLYRKDRIWVLQIEANVVYVESLHQLQLVIWSLTGIMLKPTPAQPELEDDLINY
ncbi:hypothetical protein [Rudanella lutea]|uniref:hypothetical protein n=1 Tax=Rudanella lutea TaxID=451374 RepID=UPI0012F7CFC6|nr:hypothetical protein [Rudanella lutea]